MSFEVLALVWLRIPFLYGCDDALRSNHIPEFWRNIRIWLGALEDYQFVHPSEHHKGQYSCCSWSVHYALTMEAHKFCKTANQPTKTKSKNNYCESKCILYVYLRDVLKMASKSFCISNVVVVPQPFSLNSSTSLAMKTPENTEEDPKPKDFQTEYSPD